MTEEANTFLLAASLTGMLLALLAAGSSSSCHAEWKDSGLQARWTLVGGCQVSKDGRTWIPADNYREVSP